VCGRAVETFLARLFLAGPCGGDRRIWIACVVGDDAVDGLRLLIYGTLCVLQLDDGR
jgi:hypothetical protein